jgi:hypothetical protein
MEPTDILGRLSRACIQLQLFDLRQTVRLGTWDETMAAIRALPDDVMVQLVAQTFTDAEAEILLPAIRMRGHWLCHEGPVLADEAKQVLGDIALFAAFLGCETTPTDLLVVTSGATRIRRDVALDPVWARAQATINVFTAEANPGFDCRLVNAVVHDAHPNNVRAVRSIISHAFVGAHTERDHPWTLPARLACQGFLLEAIYADGVAQVATRIL